MKLRTARRSFLKGSAAAIAGLPFLRVLPAGAATPYPKRLIIVTSANGTVMDEYWPGDGAYKKILEPLTPYKDRLLVLRGLDMKSAYKAPILPDHGPDFLNLLTGRQGYGPKQGWLPSGISIDQHIANALGARPGGRTKFPSLQLGVWIKRYAPYMSAKGDGQPLPAQDNAPAVFSTVFAGVMPATGGGAAMDSATIKAAIARRKSVLDTIVAETKDLTCQLGADEGRKLEQHLQTLRELEQRLATPNSVNVAAACQPRTPMPSSNFATGVPLMLDMVTSIAACDLSRVMTVQLANGGGGGVIYDFAHKDITKDHHTIAHGIPKLFGGTPTQQREFTIAIERWHAGQFKAFLDRLAAVKEGDGTLLDHSIVVWAHEQAVGAGHSRRDMPWVIAGGPFFGIKPGRAIHFQGKAHSALLKEFANRMEVPTAKFGDPDYADEALSLG